MATHSSVLAWRIPGTGEPGRLPSLGLHRVGHDWSNLAGAAAAAHWGPVYGWHIVSILRCLLIWEIWELGSVYVLFFSGFVSFIYFFHSSQKQSLSLYAKCWRQRGFQIMTPSFRSMHSKMQNVILSQDSPSQTAPISFSWGRLDLTGAYCIFVSLCLWYTLFLLLLQMQHVSKNIVIP